MKVREYLIWAATCFPQGRTNNPKLEVEVLMRHALGLQRSEFFASLEQNLTHQQQEQLECLVQRRFQGEPLAYITGHREFYSLDFVVNSNVLIPRQETELLVDKVIGFSKSCSREKLHIVDVGTGSGAIAIAIAHNLPNAKIYAVDIDSKALEVADTNRQNHQVSEQVQLIQGNLLEQITGRVDVIVSNPPYIRTKDIANLADEVKREPRHALDGGPDGLDVIRHLLRQVPTRLNPGGRVFIEISPEQLEPATEFATSLIPESKVSFSRDLLGLARVLEIEAP